MIARSSVTLLLVLSLGLIGTGCGASSSNNNAGQNGPPGEEERPIPAVEAVQARLGTLPLQERMSGTVRAMNQVAIYPEISAPVVEILAQNGDYVEAGAPLVRLKDTQYREQLRQAEANLRITRAEAAQAEANVAELEAQLSRTRQLAEQNFQSQQQLEVLEAQLDAVEASYEQALAQIEQAEATVDEQRTALAQTVVRAPFSGYVGQRNVELGQRADTGTRLYTMGNLDSVKVIIHVTDQMFGKIRPGQTARIHTPDSVLTAAVTRMSPFLSSESYSAAAEIEVSNEDRLLQPGMFVQVDVAYGESQQATIVPMSALYENPNTGTRGIFVAPSLGTETPIEPPDTYNPDNPPPLTQPTPTAFQPVEILAEGAQTAGVRGIAPGTWVITVGQNLLTTSTDEQITARVRPMTWTRLIALQRLQDTDLLYRFLERQQRVAEQRFGPQATPADTAPSSTSHSPADAVSPDDVDVTRTASMR